jgi:hypothetical protein
VAARKSEHQLNDAQRILGSRHPVEEVRDDFVFGAMPRGESENKSENESGRLPI